METHKYLILILLLSSNYCFSQKDTSGVFYTNNQDKRCLECLINSPKKDSLISNYGLQIVNFCSVITKQEVMIGDLEKVGLEKDEKIVKLNLHLSRSRRLVKLTGIAGVAIGVLGTVFLMR